jgi:hypothetical protein
LHVAFKPEENIKIAQQFFKLRLGPCSLKILSSTEAAKRLATDLSRGEGNENSCWLLDLRLDLNSTSRSECSLLLELGLGSDLRDESLLELGLGLELGLSELRGELYSGWAARHLSSLRSKRGDLSSHLRSKWGELAELSGLLSSGRATGNLSGKSTSISRHTRAILVAPTTRTTLYNCSARAGASGRAALSGNAATITGSDARAILIGPATRTASSKLLASLSDLRSCQLTGRSELTNKTLTTECGLSTLSAKASLTFAALITIVAVMMAVASATFSIVIAPSVLESGNIALSIFKTGRSVPAVIGTIITTFPVVLRHALLDPHHF